ncbi:MAG: arginase [Kangiellaceae bacterium]|nr:arginase [Kangiellaceae bacterium]MCW8999021.1 arginase [Kangiellaceae bacterium]MCW9015370.1 arginase [Kangiellaceae bacterium]
MIQEKKTIHIINVPLDLGASRRGTDAGPSALRIAGLSGALSKMGLKVSAESDVPVPVVESLKSNTPKARFKSEILKVCQSLANQVFDTLRDQQTPLVVGGDHSIAMGTISGIARHYQAQQQRLGVIWFDAHGDMNLPETSPSGNIHGMPLAHLLGYGDKELASICGDEPAIKPEDVVLIGLRDIDPVEREFINRSGVTAFTMRDIDQLGMPEVCRRALAIVNKDTAGFHISFDLDGCDPEVIPGTGTKVSGGVSLREAHLLLEECASDGRMTSMEVVELNPFLDQANVSAERAVAFIQSAFGRSIL